MAGKKISNFELHALLKKIDNLFAMAGLNMPVKLRTELNHLDIEIENILKNRQFSLDEDDHDINDHVFYRLYVNNDRKAVDMEHLTPILEDLNEEIEPLEEVYNLIRPQAPSIENNAAMIEDLEDVKNSRRPPAPPPFSLLEPIKEIEKTDKITIQPTPNNEPLQRQPNQNMTEQSFTINKQELSGILQVLKSKFTKNGKMSLEDDLARSELIELLEKIFLITNPDADQYFLTKGHNIIIPKQEDICLDIQSSIIKSAVANMTPEEISKVVKKVIAQNNDRIVEMILWSAPKPVLSISRLEELLIQTVQQPTNFSPMLITIILQHLEQHPEWKNYNLVFNKESLWPAIANNRELRSVIRADISNLCITSILNNCTELTCNAITRMALSNIVEDTRYDIYFASRYIQNNIMIFALQWIKQLPKHYQATLDLDKHHLNHLFMCFNEKKFQRNWSQSLDLNSILFWTKFIATSNVQRNTEKFKLISLEQVIAKRLNNIISELPMQPEQNDIENLKKLLDYFFADYNFFGKNKTLFKHTIGQILHKYPDSKVLKDLKLTEKYGRSVSFNSIYYAESGQFFLNSRKNGFFASLKGVSEKIHGISTITPRERPNS